MRTLVISIFVLLSACNTLTIDRRERTEQPAKGVSVKDVSSPYFVWGFIPTGQPGSSASLCGTGRLNSVHLNMDAGDVLLSVVTLGIYVPHRVMVECTSAP